MAPRSRIFSVVAWMLARQRSGLAWTMSASPTSTIADPVEEDLVLLGVVVGDSPQAVDRGGVADAAGSEARAGTHLRGDVVRRTDDRHVGVERLEVRLIGDLGEGRDAGEREVQSLAVHGINCLTRRFSFTLLRRLRANRYTSLLPRQVSGSETGGACEVRSRLIDEMTWEEVRDAAAAGLPAVLAVGSTEQHGPHLPLATDTHHAGRRRARRRPSGPARGRTADSLRCALAGAQRRRRDVPRHAVAARQHAGRDGQRSPDGAGPQRLHQARACRTGTTRTPATCGRPRTSPSRPSDSCGCSSWRDPMPALHGGRARRASFPGRLPGVGRRARVDHGDVDDDRRCGPTSCAPTGSSTTRPSATRLGRRPRTPGVHPVQRGAVASERGHGGTGRALHRGHRRPSRRGYADRAVVTGPENEDRFRPTAGEGSLGE